MPRRPKHRDHMYHRSTPRRGRSASPTQYGFRPREWAGQPLGVILTAYREAYGKSIEEAAQDLCIRRAHLRALETEAYATLPQLSFSTGFVRSYAKYLGLPPEDMVSRFRETYRQLEGRNAVSVARSEALSSVATVAYSPRWPSFAVLVIAAILLGSSYMVMAAYTAATDPQILSDQVGVEIISADDDLFILEEVAIPASARQSDPLLDDIEIDIDIEIGLEIDPNAAAIVETVDILAETDEVGVYGVLVPQTRPDVGDLEPLALEPANRQHRVVIKALGHAYITLVDTQTGEAFLQAEYQRGDRYLVPDGRIVRLMSQDLDRLELVIDGISYTVSPAIAALNEPLVVNPDILPATNDLVLHAAPSF